jgi:single-strand DNA-binding protein
MQKESFSMSDVLVGNLTAVPELRFTLNGKAVATFRVAVTPRIKQGDKWVDGETSFHDCVTWGKQAEHVSDSLDKGDRVVLAGSFKERSWEGRDGQTHTSQEFVADEVGFSLKFTVR